MKPGIMACLILISLSWSVVAQGQAFEGYTLYNPLQSNLVRLIDNSGGIVNSWYCTARPASIPYLLSDSTLLRPARVPNPPMNGAAVGGLIQLIAWDGTILCDYIYSDTNHQQHHDIQPMPNGNVLLVAWDRKTHEEAIAMGRQNIMGEMWPTEIVEVDPVSDSILWEWHLWDHLIQDVDPYKPNYGVVAEHPELMDINYGGISPRGEWIHANHIDYNENLDQIIFSSHNMHEFYVIDHSTTTEEAAGHTGGNGGMGGDFLYRWGNPQVYDRGDPSDQHFYVVHGVNWIDPGLPGEGNILAFNNGDRPGSQNDYSSVEEIVPPVVGCNYYIAPDSAFGPEEPAWVYSDPGTFYAPHLSGAFRLPNGNTIICEGTSGYLFEVTSSGQNVWHHNCGGQTANALKYGVDYLAFEESPSRMPEGFLLGPISPNPFYHSTTIRYHLPARSTVSLRIYDIAGRVVAKLANGEKEAGSYGVGFSSGGGSFEDTKELSTGIYFAKLVVYPATGGQAANYQETKKLILMR